MTGNKMVQNRDPFTTASQKRLEFLQLYLHLLKNDSFGVGSARERVSLPAGTQVRFLVVFVVPALVPAMIAQLTGSTKSTWLAYKRKQSYQNYCSDIQIIR